jgi:hypothetical protein
MVNALIYFNCSFGMLPVGVRLAEERDEIVEKNRSDHYPAKTLDDPIGGELEEPHKS